MMPGRTPLPPLHRWETVRKKAILGWEASHAQETLAAA
jgi:hypothetical protein